MNLETIKERQEKINSQLHSLTEDVKRLLNFIVGETQNKEINNPTEVSVPNGILEEINRSQTDTEEYFKILSSQYLKLYNKTYNEVNATIQG